MSKKYLLWKRAMHTALLILLLNVTGMGKGYAQSFTVGDLRYFVNDDGITVTVSGHVGDWSSVGGPLEIPTSVSYDGVNYFVTTIGSGAFRYYSGFTGVLTIPGSVTTIGSEAFRYCSGFTGVLTIPNSVSTIGQYAFDYCSGFTGTLIIPNTVTEMGANPFSGCSGLEQIVVAPDNPSYDSRENCNAIICTIDSTFVTGCNNTVIPNSITKIGKFAFDGCTGFTGNGYYNGELFIPNTVTEIGMGAFYGCTGLTYIDIPNSVTEIGASAFRNCDHLFYLTIPNSVTSIEDCTFAGCTSLHSVAIPNSITSIRSGAFEDCKSLSSLTIPNSVTSIGDGTFKGCESLSSLTIPNSVTSIGNYAFNGCESLISLTIPNSVTTIGNYAFNPCSGIISITCLATIPPNLGYRAFNVPGTTLTVPCGCIPAYEASDWATYFSTIVEDCSSHSISIDNNSFNGGNVSASVNSTNLGEEVILTITPNEGMALASLTVCNANDPSQTVQVYPISKGSYTYGFIMPPYDVVVKAVFMEGNAVGEGNSIAVSVYPNPTQGQVKIEVEDLKHITISNMLGQVIYEGKASGNEFAYDFSQHGEGIYLIRIETASGLVTKRVAVTR